MNTAQQLNHDAQLSLPLFFDEDTVESTFTADVIPLFSEPEPIQEIVEEDAEEEIAWSDESITEFRKAFFKHSLKTLADGRAGAKAKNEVIEWMMSEQEHPFAFITCCELFGCDPEEIRGGVWYTIRRL